VVRSAFTLIELIFAIVIIAISVISLPMMTQTVSRGTDANILQEAIFAAATELNEVVTAHWDENSIETGMPDSTARVIETRINMCENNASRSTFRQMNGHVNQPLHRRCLDDNSTVRSPDDASGTTTLVIDLNNMAHKAQKIFINATPSQTGYKRSYSSTVKVARPANFNGKNNNIKVISSTITSDGKTIATLRTYSSNIGEVDYYKRSY